MLKEIIGVSSAVVLLTSTYTIDTSVAVEPPPGIIALAWCDDTLTPGNMEIFLKTSADNGITWSTVKRLTNNSGDSSYPSVAVEGSNVHVAWRDNTPGNNEIYLRSSSDNGVTWTSARRITNTSGNSAGHSVAASGPYVYVTWLDNTTGNSEIYVKTSGDNGATWSAAKRLTTNRVTDIFGSWVPTIAVSGSMVYVAWNDGKSGNSEIYLRTSADNGVSWSAPKRLTNNGGNSSEPSIAISGSNVYISWRDDTPGNDEIYFKTSADHGASWSAPKRLTNNAGGSWEPYVLTGGSNVYVAWMDDTPGNSEIYLKTSADNGVSWSTAKRLSNSSGDSGKPSVALSGTNVNVAWHDSTPGNYEVYQKMSADNGATWSALQRITNNAGYSYAPSIAR